MASKLPDRLRRGALLLALCWPAFAAAQDGTELMLCGSSSQAANGAGFVDTLPGTNPLPPSGGDTSACMPVRSFDTTLSSAPPPSGGGGGGAGAPRVGKITVVMPAGVNAARISGLVGSAAEVASLTLLRTRSGTEGPGANRRAEFAIVLASATIDSTQTSISAGPDGPTETIVIAYRRIRWLYWLDPLAGGAPSSDLCFNLATAGLC